MTAWRWAGSCRSTHDGGWSQYSIGASALTGAPCRRHPWAMDDTTFWGLIGRLDWRAEDDDERVVAPLVKALSDMPDRDIAGFADQLARRLYALDGRAWARESGSSVWWAEPDKLSVDGFLYARLAVIASGEARYDEVLADPTRMPKDAEFESLLYVASTAYERKTGLDDDGSLDSAVSFETFSNAEGWPAASSSDPGSTRPSPASPPRRTPTSWPSPRPAPARRRSR